MDKRVIFAVAGSGKTTHIINQLNLETRSCIITYTKNNIKNLKLGILKRFGYFPKNITFQTYFSFLYSFCYRPLLSRKYRSRGISYERNPNLYAKQVDYYNYFFDKQKRLYSNRIAKFLEIQGVLESVNERLTKYYDSFLIDEVQDFAGQDFNLLKTIFKAKINITAVGDFYQHTFDTSRDGSVNKGLHDNFEKYKKEFEKAGLVVDVETLKNSHRCSPTICKFITEKLGIQIQSNRTDETGIYYLEDQAKADEVFENNNIIKLFYQQCYLYQCNSRNWGECKGENSFTDVCVVINPTTKKNFPNNLTNLPPSTRNKLYVACSRAHNDLYLVPGIFYEKYKK